MFSILCDAILLVKLQGNLKLITLGSERVNLFSCINKVFIHLFIRTFHVELSVTFRIHPITSLVSIVPTNHVPNSENLSPSLSQVSGVTFGRMERGR